MTHFTIGDYVWVEETDEFATVIGVCRHGCGPGALVTYRIRTETGAADNCLPHYLFPAARALRDRPRLVIDNTASPRPCDTEDSAA
ncbi:hypothetical protein LCGC14_1791410 [marine sediment metagenome]|uniref:Uncharacterized protein n=1 Tax=marine sediment metagenome TaxID=412755 RepID=A0A0F9GSF6_9ZZZZ